MSTNVSWKNHQLLSLEGGWVVCFIDDIYHQLFSVVLFRLLLYIHGRSNQQINSVKHKIARKQNEIIKLNKTQRMEHPKMSETMYKNW